MSGKEKRVTQKNPKSKFTVEEDKRLRSIVARVGEGRWEEIAKMMPGRNQRQCHDRWMYYLSPNVNNAPWSEEEEHLLVHLVNNLGPHWVKIASMFDRRTDTQIKNKWNVLKRRIEQSKFNQVYNEKKSEPVSPPQVLTQEPQFTPKAEDLQKENQQSVFEEPIVCERPTSIDFDFPLSFGDGLFDEEPFGLDFESI